MVTAFVPAERAGGVASRKPPARTSAARIAAAVVVAVAALVVTVCPMTDGSDEAGLPYYLRDRGVGTPTSMFGTYAEKGELLFYPFFEYYLDNNAEYSPQELGFGNPNDFRGRYRAAEGLVFLGYGLTRDVVLELEAAVIDATQHKAKDDPSTMPSSYSESGLGDVQTQFDFRWLKETAGRPEAFSYLEVVYPLNKNKKLIGTGDWEYKLGTGAIKGFGWGTMTVRAAVEYSRAESKAELGEMAVEYLKRLSPAWRVYLGVEGAQDEVELITEAQWHLSRMAFVKLNTSFGLTSKATDWAPEVGVMFRF